MNTPAPPPAPPPVPPPGTTTGPLPPVPVPDPVEAAVASAIKTAVQEPNPRDRLGGLLTVLRRLVIVAEAALAAIVIEEEPDPAPPTKVTTKTVPGGFDVTWVQPPGQPEAMISWGGGGVQLGKIRYGAVPAGLTTKRVTATATTYQVDVLTGPAGGPLVLLGSAVGTAGEGSSVPPTPAGPSTRPSVPADVRDLAGWATWRARMKEWCGCPRVGLRLLAPGDPTPAGTRWANGELVVDASTRLVGYDIQARLIVAGQSIIVDLEDVRAQGCQWLTKRAGTLRAKRVSMVGKPGSPLGQGAFQMWDTTPWMMERVELTGHADGAQISGNGTATDLWVHDLVSGTSSSGTPTHNDGLQVYGGEVLVDGYLYEGGTRGQNDVNGLVITNGATAVLRGRNVWAEVSGGNVVNPHLGQVHLAHSVLKGGATPYPGALHLTDCFRVAV